MYKAELLMKKKAEIVYKNAICEVGKIHFVSCPFGASLSLKIASLKEIYTKNIATNTHHGRPERATRHLCSERGCTGGTSMYQTDPETARVRTDLGSHTCTVGKHCQTSSSNILSSSAMSLIFLRG